MLRGGGAYEDDLFDFLLCDYDLAPSMGHLVAGDEDDSSLSTSPVSISSSLTTYSLESFDSASCRCSTSSLFSGDALKCAHRKKAVEKWLAKRARRLNHVPKKRPYVARSAIALGRVRTSGGRFVKSACKFVPACDLD
jgi:hypothetical protein